MIMYRSLKKGRPVEGFWGEELKNTAIYNS